MFGKRPQGPAATGVSVVDDQLVIRGDLDTNGTVRVDGQVAGSTHRAGTLIVGSGGSVLGHVEAREVIVAGSVHGNVNARGRVEVEPGAHIHGEVRAASMALREGGSVNGYLSIGREPQAPSSSSGRRVDITLPAQVASRSRG
jgi:cytoskeletal protein CcmA (bactofilin family)